MNRDYPNALKRFTDNILLVGINYDETTKQHTCKIEMACFGVKQTVR